MPSIKYKKKTYAGAISTAEGVSYDNTESGLAATDVQDAVDELCLIKTAVRFDTLTVTMDCTTQASYDMGGSYSGQKTLTDAEKNGASFLVPLYARKSGYESGPAISVEGGVVRLTNVHSITSVSCGILRIYT